MKKLTAQQKRDAGMALNLTELAQISGWGISSLRAMRLPLVYGKIDWTGFQRFVRKWQDDLANLHKFDLVKGWNLTRPLLAHLKSIRKHPQAKNENKTRE